MYVAAVVGIVEVGDERRVITGRYTDLLPGNGDLDEGILNSTYIVSNAKQRENPTDHK
jgi:hypothetical protein